MSTMKRTITVLVATGLLLTGCGDNNSATEWEPADYAPATLDSDAVEKKIYRDIYRELPGADALRDSNPLNIRVRCPDGIEQETGREFVCRATNGYVRDNLDVTVQNDAGDITWEYQ